MTTRIAINGFGRIGRAVLRSAIEREVELEVIAVNDVTDADTLTQLLSLDSVHGRFAYPVAALDGAIEVAGRRIKVVTDDGSGALPRWGELGADVVIEATGRLRTRADAARHIETGARKVILSAPPQGPRAADANLVLGVNFERGLGPRAPPHRQQRLVHHELPRPGGEGAPRERRHPARPDDQRSRPTRPISASSTRRTRISGAPAPRRSTPSPRPPARPTRWGSLFPSSPAASTASPSARRSPPARSSTSPWRSSGPRPRPRSTPRSPNGRRAAPSQASSPTTRSRSSRPTSSSRPTPRSSTRR